MFMSYYSAIPLILGLLTVASYVVYKVAKKLEADRQAVFSEQFLVNPTTG